MPDLIFRRVIVIIADDDNILIAGNFWIHRNSWCQITNQFCNINMCLWVGMLIPKHQNFIFNQHLEKLFSIAAVIAFHKIGQLYPTHFGAKRPRQRHNFSSFKHIIPPFTLIRIKPSLPHRLCHCPWLYTVIHLLCRQAHDQPVSNRLKASSIASQKDLSASIGGINIGRRSSLANGKF